MDSQGGTRLYPCICGSSVRPGGHNNRGGQEWGRRYYLDTTTQAAIAEEQVKFTGVEGKVRLCPPPSLTFQKH